MKDQILLKNTTSRTGAFEYANGENTKLKYLRCGWIRLSPDIPEVELDSGTDEISLIVTSGSGVIRTGGKAYPVAKFDTIFVPPGFAFTAVSDGSLEIAQASAPSSIDGQPQFISYEAALRDPELTMDAGADHYSRKVVKLIDKNVKAERLLCGLTFGAPGNWTSWSPHEHASSREEVYLYVDMPRPSFGIQMIYRDLHEVDFIAPVFEHDAVVITEGYHPNSGIPGFGINFVWMMAGLHPHTDREWADMHWQEEFVGLYG